jgi:hypothetical protein
LSPMVIRPECSEGSFGAVPSMPHPAATTTAVNAVARPNNWFRTEHLSLAKGLPTTRRDIYLLAYSLVVTRRLVAHITE